MNTARKKVEFIVVLIGIFFLIGACGFLFGNLGQKQPNELDLLKRNPSITLTPFQPVKPTPTSTVTPSPTATHTPVFTATPTATQTPVATATPFFLTGAGDISICGQEGDDQTADLLANIPGYIFTLGDSENGDGTLQNYEKCFEASWGQYKDRMIPVVGNHDYFTEHASGFFTYFGDMDPPVEKGYYSRNIQNWHIIVLNSNCVEIGGCGPSSEMAHWLEEDLQRNQQLCTMALWHIPRWSSGMHGNDIAMDTLWRLVARYGVEVVLNGHDHFYERFAPMNEDGVIDYENGTRSFVVGTGGASLRGIYNPALNSEIIDSSTFGVMKLSLGEDWYSWNFIPVKTGGFTDIGIEKCH